MHVRLRTTLSLCLAAPFVLAALGAGCTTLLGDFSSGGPAADSGIDVAAHDTGTRDAPVADAPMNVPDGGDAAVEAAADVGVGVGDASMDAETGPPWSPTVLDQQSKLALWLEATMAEVTISSSVVETWNDQSKNANNATNPTGGPQYETAVVNGHDALHFNARGVTLSIPDATSLQLGTD